MHAYIDYDRNEVKGIYTSIPQKAVLIVSSTVINIICKALGWAPQWMRRLEPNRENIDDVVGWKISATIQILPSVV